MLKTRAQKCVSDTLGFLEKWDFIAACKRGRQNNPDELFGVQASELKFTYTSLSLVLEMLRNAEDGKVLKDWENFQRSIGKNPDEVLKYMNELVVLLEQAEKVELVQQQEHLMHSGISNELSVDYSTAFINLEASGQSQTIRMPVHMCETPSCGGGTTGVNRLGKSATEKPDSKAPRDKVRYAIHAALKDLKPDEIKVLHLRFGVEVPQGHTLEEIGKQLNVTPERVCLIEAEALSKLGLHGLSAQMSGQEAVAQQVSAGGS